MDKWMKRHEQALLHGVSPYGLQIEGDMGSAGGGDAGGGGPDGTPPAPAPAGPNWEKFTESLERLNGPDGLGGRLDTLIETVKSGTPDAPAPAPVDLDGMTRQEFAAHMTQSLMTAFQAMMNESLTPVVNHVNSLSQSVTLKSVNEEYAGLKTKHKDIVDWKDDMITLAKEHPTLNITDLYGLVRTRNPTKAADLDKKYAVVEPRPQRFGGLFGNGPNGGNNANMPKLTGRESAEAAYREVAQRHPVLATLESMN